MAWAKEKVVLHIKMKKARIALFLFFAKNAQNPVLCYSQYLIPGTLY